MMNMSRSRPESIEVTGPTSFLPVLDFGSPPKSSKRLPPLLPQRKLKSNKSQHPVSTFLTLDRLEDIEEEREDGSTPPVPFRRNAADTHRKRIARLWDFNRSSILQPAPPSPDAKSISLDTQAIFSNTPEENTNSRYSFPLPPNTIPRSSVEDQLSPLDPDLTFHALLSPLSPVSPATSGSCFSPLFSGTSERFTPMTPTLSYSNKAYSLAISVAPDDKSDTPTSPSHLSVQYQRPCPSPELDPELSAHSSGSSLNSDEADVLVEVPEGLDEFQIIPRLFGSWSFDAGMGIPEEYSQAGDIHEDTRWDRAIDEVFSMVRSRRPSAQSEFGCIPDACIPPFDKDLARRLSEASTWLTPTRAAPSPPTSRSSTPEGPKAGKEEVKQVTVAPLNVKKPEKPRPAPLVTTPFYYPPARLTATDSPDFDRPPPTQDLPSAAFSPMSTYSILSPVSVPPFMDAVDVDSWPAWSAHEPYMDRRPSAAALSLMSKFSDDSIDIKIRRRRGPTGSRRSKLIISTTKPIGLSKSPSPPSAWFKRGSKTTSGVGSSFTSLNAIAAQTPEDRRSLRSSTESTTPLRFPSRARSPSPSKSVLRKSQPLETFLHA